MMYFACSYVWRLFFLLSIQCHWFKSEYKIELKTQGEAEDYYKLLKVLFILETQLSHHYKFNIKLDEKGTIHFYYGEDKIDNSKLIDFIKREYL